ncbi:MAG: transposase [Flavobacteriales bacterium]|nr:transposase [Flavobacteriales bacterium]
MTEGGYKIRNKEGIHFITFAVVDWIDVFTRKEYREIIVDSLRYCQQSKGLIVYSWCLMSNHLHLVISTRDHNTSDILRDFKKFTSKQIIQAIKEHPQESRSEWMLDLFAKAAEKNSRNKTYQFWRQDNQPKELFSVGFSMQKLEYIHNNPVEAGIVDKAEDYIYSSARDYCGMDKGLLEVEILETHEIIKNILS